jgi:hypothetical protein
MTPDDKVTISLVISFLALVANVCQPLINIYASRRMSWLAELHGAML